MIILGKTGQLAKAFLERADSQEKESGVFLCRQEFDLLQIQDLKRKLSTVANARPDAKKILINTAAFTNVDNAEKEKEKATVINTHAPALLAEWAQENGYLLVHFSTDFVFSGDGEEPWKESDAPAPLNHYGVSKLAGERAVAANCERHLIFRVSWLYGEGTNFPSGVLKQARAQNPLRIVRDQVGSPTWVNEIVRCAEHALNHVYARPKERLYGTYHLANAGYASKFDFALFMLGEYQARGLISEVPPCEPVATAIFPSPATRPLNCRLSVEKFVQTFGVQPAGWKESFREWAARHSR